MAKRLLKPEGFILAVALIVGLMAVLVFRPMPTHAAEPSWYTDYKSYAMGYNPEQREELEAAIFWELTVGFPDGKALNVPGIEQYKFANATLRFSQDVSRAEFATILGRAVGLGTDDNFPWGRVDALVKKGIITQEEKAKDIWQPITREEMAKWMGRAAIEYKADTKKANVTFPDVSDEDILAAARTGVIQGYDDGLFHPDKTAERGHGVLMLIRLVRAMNSDLPSDAELRKACEHYNKELSSVVDYRFKNGTWKRSLAPIVGDRMYAKVVYGNRGFIEGLKPNTTEVTKVTIIEKHNNLAQVKVDYDITFPNGEVHPDNLPDASYLRKVDGKWMLVGARSYGKMMWELMD